MYDISYVLLLTCSISIMYFKFAHTVVGRKSVLSFAYCGFLKCCRRVKRDGDELRSRSVLITYRSEC